MPVLLQRMGAEENIKLKTQVVGTVANFVRTLISDDEGMELTGKQKDKAKGIILEYSTTLVTAISELFAMSIA
jgi:hypothetical protein